MRIVAILQARMNGRRLPGKMMLPLAGKPLVQNVIERVQRAKRLDDCVLAIPAGDWPTLGQFGDLCSVWNPVVPDHDLVARYLDTAERFRADLIVRICCDNPCVEPEYIDEAVEEYLRKPYVFYSNTTDYVTRSDKQCDTIDGIGAEVFSISRLKWLDRLTRGRMVYREHPHQFFFDKYSDSKYHDCGIAFGPINANYRLDVNTQADYDFIKGIYDHFGHNRFHITEVLAYLNAKEVST